MNQFVFHQKKKKMLKWTLVMVGWILLNPTTNAWNSNAKQRGVHHDDCHHCHTRVEELEQTIRGLKRKNQGLEQFIGTIKDNIYEHILNSSLQQRLLSHTFDGNMVIDRDPSMPWSDSFRERRQGSGTDTNCIPYPNYVNSNQCTICGGNNASNPWDKTCEGRCKQQINSSCANGVVYSVTISECLKSNQHKETICIDCSDVSANLEQVPCPPEGYSGENTGKIVLLLDNNQHLNLNNAFRTGTQYSTNLGGISLTNTALNGTQFKFDSMTIGYFDMSSATVSGGISDFAFIKLVSRNGIPTRTVCDSSTGIID